MSKYKKVNDRTYSQVWGVFDLMKIKKKKQIVSRSSAEAEYRSIDSAVAELTWFHGLFKELGVSIHSSMTVLSDSKAAMQIVATRERNI